MYLLPFHQVTKVIPIKSFKILHGQELIEIKCMGLNLNYEFIYGKKKSFIKDSPDSITNKPL